MPEDQIDFEEMNRRVDKLRTRKNLPIPREDFNEDDVANSYWDQFVPKEYEMDPETEDVLYSERLRDGMVVLIEQDNFRESIPHIQKHGSPGALANALKHNRWTTVSNLTKYSEDEITFIGVYSDGRKTQYTSSIKQAWYVKLDSIPEEDPLAAEEAELKEAMASLVETSEIAWQNILDMLKQGVKAEADLLDEAATRLWDKSQDLKFSEKPEDLGDQTDRLPPEPGDLSDVKADGLPYFRKATIDDIVRDFIRKNRAFIDSKDVHSLNELHPMYNHYCDKVGFQWKLSRRDFMQHLKSYFRTYANVEDKDEHGSFESDTHLTGFVETVENGLVQR